MMLWDSLPIVRLRTQVCQSSRWWQTGWTYLVCEQDTGSIVYRFFNDCVTMEIRETDNSPPSRLLGCFPSWPTFHLVSAPILNFQFGSGLAKNKIVPSWIWRTIASIVLQTIAYCLSRLLTGYRSYKRPLLLSDPLFHIRMHFVFNPIKVRYIDNVCHD